MHRALIVFDCVTRFLDQKHVSVLGIEFGTIIVSAAGTAVGSVLLSVNNPGDVSQRSRRKQRINGPEAKLMRRTSAAVLVHEHGNHGYAETLCAFHSDVAGDGPWVVKM